MPEKENRKPKDRIEKPHKAPTAIMRQITDAKFTLTREGDDWKADDRGDRIFKHPDIEILRDMVLASNDKRDHGEVGAAEIVGRSPASVNGNGSATATKRAKQPYLPGTEDIKELDDQADVCLQCQDDQELAKSNFTVAKDRMKVLMKANKRTNYKRGGWNMTIKNNEVLEIKQEKNRKGKKIEEVDTVIDPQD